MSATRTKSAKTGAKAGRKPNAATPRATSAESGSARRQPREGSTMWAVMKVLDGKRTPMTAVEIHAEIAKRKLATGLKGKTPDQTVAAALAVHAKKGLYVERAAPGKFQLRKGAAAAAAVRTIPLCKCTGEQLERGEHCDSPDCPNRPVAAGATTAPIAGKPAAPAAEPPGAPGAEK